MIEELYTAEAQLSREWLATKHTIDNHSTSGAPLLEAVLSNQPLDTTETGFQVTQWTTKLATIEAAINEARSRRRAAILETWAAQAANVEQEAGQLALQISERQSRWAGLVQQLSDFEECKLTIVFDRPTWQNDGLAPKTQQLLDQLATLNRKALELSKRQPSNSGSISGATPDDVIAALLTYDVMGFAPTVFDVFASLHAEHSALTEKVAEHKRKHWNCTACLTTIQLSWNGDTIKIRAAFEPVYQAQRDIHQAMAAMSLASSQRTTTDLTAGFEY